MPITKEELDWANRHWNTANYLAAASIYLKDNFLMERKLNLDDIKDSLLGHWGTCPGINFIYTHLNLLGYKTNANILPIVGPGHGFAAVLANLFIDGSLKKYYPDYTNDKKGIGKLIKSFCWPEGFPSHANPSVPGTIHEGGELGYALSTGFGAAFDNPDLLVPVIIGDGEAETGPTAAAWHSNKFLNPKTDGTVLPILHLNGFKISSPTIYGTMSDSELKSLFVGYGYEPIFVGESHKQMADALEYAYSKIKKIKSGQKPIWPMIILKTRKGWTGVKKDSHGNQIEGNYRSHQVPLRDLKTNPKSFKLVEDWLLSYKPDELFKFGKIPSETLKFIPEIKLGDNPNALGGNKRIPLVLPNVKKFEVKIKKDACSGTEVLGKYLKSVFELNKKNNNFRIMSPDELSSNRLDAVLEATKRAYVWPNRDHDLSPNGRVMEILSEHTLQGWLQGYLLTGRHGLFPSYEAFLPIIDSMVSQHLKFLKVSKDYKWRKPIPALNYLLTSVCWRQDHNGFSHQNPGFINVLLDKETEEQWTRFYFPADANMLLAQTEHVLQSTNRINIIVADKHPIKQWLTYDEAVKQCKSGAGVWKFISDNNPDVVLSACGDYQTQEAIAAIKIVKKEVPDIKIRFVNVSELNVIGNHEYANSLSENEFIDLFTKDKDVIFNFHGYPDTIKQLLFDRKNVSRFSIYGYNESGSTTTPFDMLIRNKVSRYHLAMYLLESAAKVNPKVERKSKAIISKLKDKIREHRNYIVKHGKDPEEINE